MSLNRTQIVDWLYRCGDIFTKESDFLTGLDKEIGDADHGLNMHRGFSKVVEKLPSIADKDIGFILKNTGMTLLSNVGGASGPLFGTFFIRAAQVTQAHQSLTLDELYQMIREGAAGVTGSGFIVLAATLSAVGNVPVAGLALILGIDRFMSEARALTNLIGNGVATVVVGKWTGDLDTERMQAVLDNQADELVDEPEVVLDAKSEHMAATH